MNVLALGAHFDDIELGCGGAIAKHVANGDSVTVFVATDSGFTGADNTIIRSSETAKSEALDAMKELGVEDLVCGNFKTLELEFIDELNVEILKLVESRKIDLVYTHWSYDIHHDHQALARASLHGCRHVKRMLMYRSNWYHSTEEFRGNFYIDISKFWEKKKKSIEAHKSEMERTGKKWIQFFDNEAINAGQRIGVDKAEVFQLVKWIES